MPSKAELLRKAMQPKSDQLNADDLVSSPLTIKVIGVDIKMGDQPVSVHWEGENGRPYKPCKTMMKILSYAWGEDPDQWVGGSLRLYMDPNVVWAGEKVGGIRISHMDKIEKSFSLSLAKSKSKKETYVVEPLSRLNTKQKPQQNNSVQTEQVQPQPEDDAATLAYIDQQKKNLEVAAAAGDREFINAWTMIPTKIKPALNQFKEELKAKYSKPAEPQDTPAVDPNDLLAALGGSNGPEDF